MTEDCDIDIDFENPYDDLSFSGYDYIDCDEHYRAFLAGWDLDEPVYWIQQDTIDGYYYVNISYFENTELEIGRITDLRVDILLRINNSPFDRVFLYI
jgi:hypothetical protein